MESSENNHFSKSQNVELLRPFIEDKSKIIEDKTSKAISDNRTNKSVNNDNHTEVSDIKVNKIELVKQIKTEGNESDFTIIDENGKKQQNKRKSKNDADGRDFKCTFCIKTYLSYPALYTHMKSKHSQGPDGQNFLLNSGRGRGRPKKNAGRVNTIDPQSDDYFKTFDKCGCTMDILEHFDSVIEELFSEQSTAECEAEIKLEPLKIKKETGINPSVLSRGKLTTNARNDCLTDANSITNKLKNDNLRVQILQSISKIKEENNGSISDSQITIKSFDDKVIFKQTKFRVYNDYKEHPLFTILAKKKLKCGLELECNRRNKSKRRDIKKTSNQYHEIKLEEIREVSETDTIDGDIDNSIKNFKIYNDQVVSIYKDNILIDQNRIDTQNEIYQSSLISELRDETNNYIKRDDKVLQEYELLTPEEKQDLCCDEVCGIYLRDVSLKINSKFYKTVLKFIVLFRECLNEYGWQKIKETQKLLKNQKIKIDIPLGSFNSMSKYNLQQQQMIIISEIG